MQGRAWVYCKTCRRGCSAVEHRDDDGRVIGVTWKCRECQTSTLVGKREAKAPPPVVSAYSPGGIQEQAMKEGLTDAR